MKIDSRIHRYRLATLSLAVAAALAGCDAKAPADSGAVLSAVPEPQSVAPVQPVPSTPSPTVGTRVPASPVARTVAEPLAFTAEPAYRPPPEVVYADYQAPMSQPVPVAVPWAPPPMYLETISPQPRPDATWTGGYWVWHGNWVWAPGRWATPPRPRYHWVPPYYEHRQDRVVFVDGFWSPPQVSFVPPPQNLVIALAVIGAGVAVGHAVLGPEGPFVPAPPGSRLGLIVPAPIGTAPAVVSRAPAIIAPGMRVTNRVDNIDRSVNTVNRTTINNRNTTVVNNITNVTIEAPAAATANHTAVRVSVPAQPHLAAMQPPLAQTEAPPPVQAPTADASRVRPGQAAPAKRTEAPQQPAPVAPQPPLQRPQPQPQPQPQIQQQPSKSPAPTTAEPRQQAKVEPPQKAIDKPIQAKVEPKPAMAPQLKAEPKSQVPPPMPKAEPKAQMAPPAKTDHKEPDNQPPRPDSKAPAESSGANQRPKATPAGQPHEHDDAKRPSGVGREEGDKRKDEPPR